MRRRDLLTGLGGLAALGGLLRPGPARAGECALEGPSVPAVTGPFPPIDFLPTLRGAANPGARRPVGENDMDLAALEGAGGPPLGQIVLVRGQVITAGCVPVVGAAVQIWQADAAGHYNHENERGSVTSGDLDPHFGYWGSTLTDEEGRFQVRTIVPGAYPAGGTWWRPPHLHWRLKADGLPEVITQSYFDGDALEDARAIRKLTRKDLILNLQSGFTEGFDGEALARARQRALQELVVGFAAGATAAEPPTGSITFRVG